MLIFLSLYKNTSITGNEQRSQVDNFNFIYDSFSQLSWTACGSTNCYYSSKSLEVLTQINCTLKGSKEQISCSRIECNIFLKGRLIRMLTTDK